MDVIDYASGKLDEPPILLRWYWLTRRYGLPYAGGWMDQPAGLVDKMALVGLLYDAKVARMNVPAGEVAKWKNSNRRYAKILKWAEDVING